MIPGTIDAESVDGGNEDGDSVLSDDFDEDELIRAAMHFGGGNLRNANPRVSAAATATATATASDKDLTRNSGNQQKISERDELNLGPLLRSDAGSVHSPPGTGTCSENDNNTDSRSSGHGMGMGMGMESRTSLLSRDASTNSSNSDTDKTIQRKNSEFLSAGPARFSLSHLSIQMPQGTTSADNTSILGIDDLNRIIGNQSPTLTHFEGMAQIDEDCNEDHSKCSNGWLKNAKRRESYNSNAASSTTRTVPSEFDTSISTMGHEESDDIAISRWNDAFQREVQRLSAGGGGGGGGGATNSNTHVNRSSIASNGPSQRSNLRSSLRMSGKKRSSYCNSFDAAASEAASFFEKGNYSDSDDGDGDGDGDSDSLTNSDFIPHSGVGKRGSTGAIGRNLKIDYSDERPRKRLSATSGTSRLSNPSLDYIPGSNSSAISAAQAIFIADEADRKYALRLGLYQDNQADANNNNAQPRRTRRAQRRAGFSVPSCQREAAAAQAERLKLLEKDRIESRLGRRGVRRSISYSSGIKVSSDIIASTLHEEIATNVGVKEWTALEVEENHDFQQLRKNRIQRRVNSMPDPNAIHRLSQSGLNANVDFTEDPTSMHSRSSLSATLDASCQTAIAPMAPPYSQPPVHDVSRHMLNVPTLQHGLSHHIQQHQHQPSLPRVPSFPNTLSMASSSFGSLNFNPLLPPPPTTANIEFESAMAIQSLIVQTAEATQQVEMLAQIAQKAPILPNFHNSHGTIFNDDEFDGKQTLVSAIEISENQQSEYEACLILHNACERDDIYVATGVSQNFLLSTRFALEGLGTGDTALHVAVKHDSNIIMRWILQHHPDCALIRNALGYTPLHYAAELGHMATANTLINKVPQCAQIQCDNGCLPLHDSVSTGAEVLDTPQIMSTLLHAFQKAVFVTNDEGLLPLHLAAMSGFEAGLRTLLASEFSSIYSRDKLEGMLPLDLAVHQLAELISEESSDSDQEDEDSGSSDNERDPKKAKYISCIEMLLSSMLYKRLLSSPRISEDKPFLPLHSVILARPHIETWTTLYNLYGDEHSLDIDPLGRNIAHSMCSRAIEYIDVDLNILESISDDLFTKSDFYGFLPIHLSLQNGNAPFQFITEIAKKYPTSLNRAVPALRVNKYANFLPVHIAAASDCDLNIIYFLLRISPPA